MGRARLRRLGGCGWPDALFALRVLGDRFADLDRVEDLQRIAAGAGLDPEDLRRALDEGRYEALLDRHREEAMSMGINAIPAHIVRRYLLVGAHRYEAFIEVLDKLRADENPTVASVYRSASTGQTR